MKEPTVDMEDARTLVHHAQVHRGVPHLLLCRFDLQQPRLHPPLFHDEMVLTAKAFGLQVPGDRAWLRLPSPRIHFARLPGEDPNGITLVSRADDQRRLVVTRWGLDGHEQWCELARTSAKVQVVVGLTPCDVVADDQALEVQVDRGIDDATAEAYLDSGAAAVARGTARVLRRATSRL